MVNIICIRIEELLVSIRDLPHCLVYNFSVFCIKNDDLYDLIPPNILYKPRCHIENVIRLEHHDHNGLFVTIHKDKICLIDIHSEKYEIVNTFKLEDVDQYTIIAMMKKYFILRKGDEVYYFSGSTLNKFHKYVPQWVNYGRVVYVENDEVRSNKKVLEHTKYEVSGFTVYHMGYYDAIIDGYETYLIKTPPKVITEKPFKIRIQDESIIVHYDQYEKVSSEYLFFKSRWDIQEGVAETAA